VPAPPGILHEALRCRASAAALSPPASAPSRDAGRNSRQSTAADAQSVTACTLTPTWQFPTLPNVPLYIRATPGDPVPSLANPVSSTTYAPGASRSSAHPAIRRRTSP
jgi:hypothetical protein